MSAADDLPGVVASGNRLASLEALRDKLATSLDGASDRQLIHVAPLAKQLAAVLKEIDDLKPAQEASELDDIAAQRAKRRSAASGK